MKTPDWNFWAHVPEAQLWQVVLLSLGMDPNFQIAITKSSAFITEAANRLQLLVNDRSNRLYFSTVSLPTNDPRRQIVRTSECVAWAASVAKWPNLSPEFLSLEQKRVEPSFVPKEIASIGEFSPAAAKRFRIAFYDHSMDAKVLFSLKNVSPKHAAMALCRINKGKDGNPKLIFVDGRTDSPDQYRQLLKLFKDVAKSSPEPRTLLEWRAIALHHNVRYHPWVDEYANSIPSSVIFGLDSDIPTEPVPADDVAEKSNPAAPCQPASCDAEFPSESAATNNEAEHPPAAVPNESTAPDGALETAQLDNLNFENEEGIKKREKQIRAILCIVHECSYQPLNIPWGGKKKIMGLCKQKYPALFGAGDDPFRDTWKLASAKKRVRVAHYHKYR